jgi:hypothetical protein
MRLRNQLHFAMEKIAEQGAGHHQLQEGRGVS